MSRPVRAGDPSRRTKFPGASCGEQLKSHPSVSAKQGRTSHCFVSLEMMYVYTEYIIATVPYPVGHGS